MVTTYSVIGRNRDGVNSHQRNRMVDNQNNVMQQGLIDNDTSTQQPQEKLIPQSQVNALVGMAKQQAYERGQRDSQSAMAPQANAAPQVDENTLAPIVNKLLGSHLQTQQQLWEQQQAQAQAHKTAAEISSKMADARSRYDDYDNVIGNVNTLAQEAPQLFHLANSVDNGGEVLYHLNKNVGEMGNLLNLPPSKQVMAIRQLSQSIKDNQTVKAAPASIDVPNQSKPSNVSVSDNGRPGSSKNYWKGRT
jgi:hypothetical protein